MNNQVVVNNFLISYSEAKGDNKQDLLFLHGWRGQKEVWNGVIQKLGNYEIGKFNAYALDLPGFGKSDVPKNAMTVGDYAKVVAGFIKKLELKNVVVVGHSFGGRVGIKLAAQHPELISKLVLADSAGFAMEPNKKSLMSGAAKIVKPLFKPKFMQGLRKKIYQSIGAEDYLATPDLQKTFVNVIGEDLTEDMKNITCPTLIISGENDIDTPVEFGQKMQSLIPNSKFLILSAAGHFSFIDQPEKFAEALNKFLQ